MRSKIVMGGFTAAVAFLLVTNPVVVEAAGLVTGAGIKNNSITGKDIKTNSVKGADVKESSLKTVPSAARVGTLTGAQIQDKASVLFATVEPADANPVIKNARGVIEVDRVGTGFFDVRFNRDVSNCTWMASYGKTGSGVDAVFATTRDASNLHETDPSWMGVVLRDADGTQVDGDGFNVLALCP